MKFDPSIPVLYLITDGTADDGSLAKSIRRIRDIIRRAIDLNFAMVQIREKNLSARSLYLLAREAMSIARETATRVLVNDRVDIAVASGADGVHLTAGSMPVDAVRSVVPSGFLVGISTHSIAEIESARDDGADFAVYGPAFETPGKGEPKGVEDLADVCRRAGDFPVIALGGVDETNFDQVIAAGACGAAAIRWLNDRAGAEARA